jgi:hypothetical protein
MNNTRTLATLAGATLATILAGTASADLTGTTLNLSINHTGAPGALSAINNVTHTYGTTDTLTVPNWGSVVVSTPAPAPGAEHAMNVDFTLFGYSAFGFFGSTGTIKLNNLAETADLSSVRLLANGMDIATAVSAATGGFQVSWDSTTLLAINPTTPNVTVAWNTLPGPGALAMLGLAGLTPRHRRKH